jgi:RNA polymerase sigma-70 factor (ECF subfamily)
MVRLRLGRRLQGRIDDSDVLQASFLAISKKMPECVQQPVLPFSLWLRRMTGLNQAEVNRRHRATHMRGADP